MAEINFDKNKRKTLFSPPSPLPLFWIWFFCPRPLRRAARETQADQRLLSHSGPRGRSDRSGWWVDGSENDAGQGEGGKKKVRLTCGDMLWLLPRLDRAGLIMDGLLLLDEGSATESQIWLRPGCLLAARIIGPLMFYYSGSQALRRSCPRGFKMSFLSGEVNSSSSWCFMTDPFLTHGPLAQGCPLRATGWCKQAEKRSGSHILNCLVF